MRLVSLLVVAWSLIAAPPAPPPKLTGGTGTIYLGSYARRIVAIDEATEKVMAEIPLKTGSSGGPASAGMLGGCLCP